MVCSISARESTSRWSCRSVEISAALIVNTVVRVDMSHGRFVGGRIIKALRAPPDLFSLSMVTASPLQAEEKICSDFADNLTTHSLKYSKMYYLSHDNFSRALLTSYHISCVYGTTSKISGNTQ
jgi:hypothetical protein